MMNNWKRPRQTMNSAPQPTQAVGRTGPAGAATYPDLMPVGGFNRNMNQRQGFPTSGRGAANINRNTNTNAYSNPTSGGRFPLSANQKNFVQNSPGPYQQQFGVNNMQNRSARSWTQPYNPEGSCDQTDHYFDETNLSLDGDDFSWNGGQRMFSGNRVIANKGAPLYGHGPSPYGQTYIQQQQQKQQRQQMRSQFKTTCTGRGGTGRNQRGNFRCSTYTSAQSVQAGEIADKGIDTFPMPTTVLPGPRQSATRGVVKVTSPNKTAVSEVKKSLHFLTVDVAGVKRWSKFKEDVQIMFEVFGHLDSAVAREKKDCKEFLIKDDKRNGLACIFYEIDRQLPKLTRGQWYRIVGTYDGDKEKFHCFSIRAFQPAEGYLAPVISQKSAETMCKLTQHLREP